LQEPLAFALDPDLSLGDQAFFPKPEFGNFGIFLDSSPDRWGQTLMKRREALQAKDDGRDIGAWKFVVHGMASQTGMHVPEARMVPLNNEFHTFCVKRFDRVAGKRRCYASAMTLLRRAQSEGAIYLELAQFLRTSGDPQHRTIRPRAEHRRPGQSPAPGNRGGNFSFLWAQCRPGPQHHRQSGRRRRSLAGCRTQRGHLRR
jgi:hypothetical protein